MYAENNYSTKQLICHSVLTHNLPRYQKTLQHLLTVSIVSQPRDALKQIVPNNYSSCTKKSEGKIFKIHLSSTKSTKEMLSTEHFVKLNHLLLFLDKDLRSGQN